MTRYLGPSFIDKLQAICPQWLIFTVQYILPLVLLVLFLRRCRIRVNIDIALGNLSADSQVNQQPKSVTAPQ